MRLTSQRPQQDARPASGTVLLSDNFDDPAVGWLPTSFQEPSPFRRGYADGEYRLEQVDPTTGIGEPLVTLPGTYGDLSLAMDARLVGPNLSASYYVQCRRSTGSFSDLRSYRLWVMPEARGFTWSTQMAPALLKSLRLATSLMMRRTESLCYLFRL